ncbi:uncharacterized protein [Rutidosis leptorrhynchoides]|uniref:uncharacterized protein n=1 Tax=Rutidosis leptorrhynchoides TaxID=125765 RepID=UPI003A98FE05
MSTTTIVATSINLQKHPTNISTFFTKLPSSSSSSTLNLFKTTKLTTTKLHVSSPTNNSPLSTTQQPKSQETIYFDGGAHYGDLVANLVLGFTLVWLPLTLAAVLRGFFLRYRFTNLRVTVISGLTGQDRSDFSYKVIKDVQVVPRFIGEWGDVIITLTDGTKVDLRSVPRFREIAKYVSSMSSSANESELKSSLQDNASKGF